MTTPRTSLPRPRALSWGVWPFVLLACVSRTEVFEALEPPPRDPDCEGTPFECVGSVLPELDGVTVEVRGDTATIAFAGAAGARDYRVYAMPAAEDLRATDDGRVFAIDVIYRCAGDRPLGVRPEGNSLAGDIAGIYTRRPEEGTLGHVFLAPGEERVEVRRLADPRADADADFGAPAIAASRTARYVLGEAAAALLSRGYRDDGVAFYAPQRPDATHAVYAWQSAPRGDPGRRLSTYFVAGPERTAFESDPLGEAPVEDFRALSQADDESVPLRRIFYEGGHDHDVLAAGEAQFERLLGQGNSPHFVVTWPNLEGPTTLVVEALDIGCPFAGHVAPDVVSGTPPSNDVSVEAARLGSGELFLNGQHDPANRPSATRRSLIEVSPEPEPSHDWFDGFTDESAWAALEAVPVEGGLRYENDDWIVRTNTTTAHTVGALFGQLWLGLTDGGSPAWLQLEAKHEARLGATAFLHATVAVSVAATGRRYPELTVSTPPLPDATFGTSLVLLPIGVPNAIVGQAVELQLQVCEQRAWQPEQPCSALSLFGRRVGDPADARPWAPVPVLGELAGFDLLVRLDAYVSTERVYVFVNERPAGCAVLPGGVVPAGPATVHFGLVSADVRSDEATRDELAPHQYLRARSPARESRRFDDFGISSDVSLPAWNEALYPCEP